MYILDSRQVCGFSKNEHFINGLGNRRVTLYIVDALLVPRVFILLTLAAPQCVIYSTVITKINGFSKYFVFTFLKISTGKF